MNAPAQIRDVGLDAAGGRTMNRIANMLATAVLLGLLPVCLAVWKGWL